MSSSPLFAWLSQWQIGHFPARYQWKGGPLTGHLNSTTFSFFDEDRILGFHILPDLKQMFFPYPSESVFLLVLQPFLTVQHIVLYVSSLVDSFLFLPCFDQRLLELVLLPSMPSLVHALSRYPQLLAYVLQTHFPAVPRF